MSYQLALDPPAVAAVDALPLSLLDGLEAELRRLADSPTSVSVPGGLPFRADRMLFHFSVDDHDGGRWDFVAHFRYGTDEQTIHVIALTVLPPNPPAA